MSKGWYIVATVDDDVRLGDGPMAILGPWDQIEAQRKCDMLKANHPKRDFGVRFEDEVEIDHANKRVRVVLREA